MPPPHPNTATTSCARRHCIQIWPQHHAHAATASKHGHNIIHMPPPHPNTATTSCARRHCIQIWPQHHPHAATASKHGHNIIRTSPPHPNMATTSSTHPNTATTFPTVQRSSCSTMCPSLSTFSGLFFPSFFH